MKITLEATGVLENTFLTNVPSASNDKIKCSYDGTDVICSNVGALVSTTTEYFLAVKAYYSNSAADPTNYGKVVF